MGILDVHCCVHVVVPKIPLNDFHVHVQRYEKRRAEVAQVMESDARQTILFEHFRKVLADIVWSDEVAERIDADHIEVLFGVVPAVESAVFFLRFPMSQRDFFHLRGAFVAAPGIVLVRCFGGEDDLQFAYRNRPCKQKMHLSVHGKKGPGVVSLDLYP